MYQPKTEEIMKNIFTFFMAWVWLWAGMLLPAQTHAQTSPRDQLGILKLTGKITHFNTGVDLSALLDEGTYGEATFEFWFKPEGWGARDWKLGDLLPDDQSFQIHGNDRAITIFSPNKEEIVNWKLAYHWNHLALVFNGSGLTIYLNGSSLGDDIDLGEFDTSLKRRLFFHKSHVLNDMYLTEIRAWSEAREQGLINEQRWLAYPLKSHSELRATHEDSGLQLLLGGSALNTASFEPLPDLSQLRWPNVLIEKNPDLDVPAGGSATRTYKNLTISTIDTNSEHPILDNTHIFLYASNGDYEDKVVLEWMVLQDGEEYRVFKDNQLVSRINKEESENGFFLTYEDDNVLPGDFYTYRVEVFKEDGTQLSDDEDGGFIHYNGLIAGTIKTQSDIFVEGVKVVARPESGRPIGSALQLSPGKSKIHVRDIRDLTDVKESILIEFWYQKEETSGPNTLIEMDEITIRMEPSQLVAQYNEHSISLPLPEDDDWHHYAILLGPDTARIYRDGEADSDGASNNTGFVPHWSSGLMELNSEIGHKAKLDELRIWDMDKRTIDGKEETDEAYWQRVAQQIARNYALQVSGLESGLLMYFRFDAGAGDQVFDIARNTRERTRGEISQSSAALHDGTIQSTIEWVTDVAQLPEVFPGTYTDAGGNYTMASINYGDATTFVVTPSRPDYAFAPDHQDLYLQRSLDRSQYAKEGVDFTDISSLPIAGRVYYHTDPDETFATYQDCNSCYPVPKGAQITIGGVLATSASDDAQTDLTGLYSISAPLGQHAIQVSNPPRQQSFGTRSVYFDGSGYLRSSSIAMAVNGDSWVLSGWIKPEDASGTQTILDLGGLDLVLEDQLLKLKADDTEVVSSTVQVQTADNEFTFFAIVYDVKTNKFGLYVADTYDEQTSATDRANQVNGRLYTGATYDEDTGETSNYFTGHLDQLELRRSADYLLKDAFGTPMPHQILLESIKTGELIQLEGQPELFDLTTGLEWSFTFEHTQGTRAVAYGSTFYELDLFGGVSWHEGGASYTREFSYEYEASNDLWNPQGDAYNLNITQAYTELHFENKTRFGLVGQIIVPCGNSAGQWTGSIKRTDVIDPEFLRTSTEGSFKFNNDSTLFAVEGLLPGSYRVTLTNVADPTRTIQSPVIDISKGWAMHDFEYRNPLEISYELRLVALNDEGAFESTILEPLCDSSHYELEAGKQYQLVVNAYERYGDEQCPVGEATVSVGGDAALFAQGEYSTYTGDDPNTDVEEFTGRISIPFIANTPNFQGDFSRMLNISVSHDGRNVQRQVATYNTGARQEESNFTISSPRVISILHDPPGGNSSAYLEKGQEIIYSSGFEEGFNQSASLLVGSGINVETEIGTFTGLGAGVTTEYKVMHVKTSWGVGLIQESSYKKIDHNIRSVSFSRTITTSSDPTIVGMDADVYIGMGQVIHIGRGKHLYLNEDDCLPILDDNVDVAEPGVESFFVYTHQDIKDVLIPQLEIVIEAESDSNKQTDLRRQVREWSNILKNNEENINAIEDHKSWMYEPEIIYETITKPVGGGGAITTKVPVDTIYKLMEVADLDDEGLLNSEISFSGGVEISYAFDRSNEEGKGSYSGGGAGLKEETTSDITINGTAATFSQTFQVIGFRYNNKSESVANSTAMGFTLYDGDNGDHFNVAVKQDPVYLTPIFKTMAGQSMCPYEAGTQPREGVELTLDDTHDVHALYGEEAVFPVTLKNTQVGVDATPKRYWIAVNRGEVPDGAIVRYNGDPLGAGLPIAYEAGETEKNGVITVTHPDWAQGGQLDYENIPIMFYSGCERDGRLYSSYHIDELKATNCGTLPYRSMYITDAGEIDATKKAEYDQLVADWQACSNHTKMVDIVELSAHFRSPCVQEIQLKKPGNDWVVNATSDNRLELVFAIAGLTQQSAPDGLKLRIERYDQNNPTEPLLLEMLQADALSGFVQTDGYVHYLLDVSGLADGDYKLRLTPQCGNDSDTETWRRQTPTEWMEGHIFRTQPVITEVTPTHGGVMGEDRTVTITYDRPIQHTGVSSANISLRGVLAGESYVPKSALFDGTQVTIPHQEALSLDSAFTIEFWMKVLNLPSGTVNIMSKGSQVIRLMKEGAIGTHVLYGWRASLDQWVHVAWVYDGNGHVKLIIDKNPKDGNISYTFDNINGAPIIIGSPGLEAQLDEIRIWNIARDPAQIRTDQARRLLGNEDGLVGYYVMDDIALEGEVIRDFTGLASGTTAQNLTFVTNDGAPISMESIVQDVPAEVVRAGTREIIIQPKANLPVWVYEGTELTAFIKDGAVRGAYGNPAEGKSWTFRVNSNNVAWAQAGKTVFVPHNATADVGFSMDLINKSSNDVQYRLVADQLPDGVHLVGEKGADQNYTLYGTYSGEPVTHTLTFAVDKNLITGFTDASVTAEVLDMFGAPIAYERFLLDVHVATAGSSASGMNVWAEVEINGEVSEDVNDHVSARMSETMYDQQSVVLMDGKYLVYLQIPQVGEEANGNVLFNAWDASVNEQYISAAHPFMPGNYGSAAQPVKLIFNRQEGDELVSGIDDPDAGYQLRNHPNPMEDKTSISYKLADQGQVVLQVMTISGGVFRTLVDQYQQAGEYEVEWDGASDAGNKLPSGMYIYTLSVNGHLLKGKIIIQ